MSAELLSWWPVPVVLVLCLLGWRWWCEQQEDELTDAELEFIRAELSRLDLPSEPPMRVTGPDSPDVVLVVEKGPDGRLRRPR